MANRLRFAERIGQVFAKNEKVEKAVRTISDVDESFNFKFVKHFLFVAAQKNCPNVSSK